MPTSPKPRTRLASKPFPSSSMLTRRCFGSWRTTTRTFFAYACFEQLFKASCTILYTHVLYSSGKFSETFSSTVSTSMPVRLDTSRACQSSAKHPEHATRSRVEASPADGQLIRLPLLQSRHSAPSALPSVGLQVVVPTLHFCSAGGCTDK